MKKNNAWKVLLIISAACLAFLYLILGSRGTDPLGLGLLMLTPLILGLTIVGIILFLLGIGGLIGSFKSQKKSYSLLWTIYTIALTIVWGHFFRWF
jgi:hypothetical protein